MPTVYAIHQLSDKADRETRLSVTCDYYDKGWAHRVIDAQSLGLYVEVAGIVAEDLDEVFEIGNFMGGDKQPVLNPDSTQRMHSVSIGDIIHNMETDECHVVAQTGFTRLF